MTTSRPAHAGTCATFPGPARSIDGHQTGQAQVSRPRRAAAAVVLLVAALVQNGCTADGPDRRPHEGDPDGGMTGPLEAPELEPVPERTPLDLVTVRGSTVAMRVVSRSSRGTILTSVLPGGDFCQDTPIAQVEDNRIEFFAVGGDGRLSPPTTIDVAYDATAAEPASGTCTGSSGECAASETCGDDDDDEDCNGFADDCDLSCSGCDDDLYEPNDFAINVPSLQAGTYSMKICPCHDDWFAFHVTAGESITVTASFSHAVIDLDLALFPVAPDGGSLPRVAFSTTTQDVESIDYVSEEGGTYYLRIFPYPNAQKTQGGYELVIE